ncbi:hypothetical protein SPFL3102_01363 [Sporomusaceae bacterium FL31]|nr:hypothetical protein SPFL3101_00028 [Sporomusaceae bacterium FL31]GCE33555.1 hypothetical protein SPFL3102_01363 [Sporomusaceae bacterium]
MNLICQNCKQPIVGEICLFCGTATYHDDDVTVVISPLNYATDRIEEISRKFMSPLVQGAIQHQIK